MYTAVLADAAARFQRLIGGGDAGRDRSLFRCVLENEVLNSGIEDLRDLQTKKRRVFAVSVSIFSLFSTEFFDGFHH